LKKILQKIFIKAPQNPDEQIVLPGLEHSDVTLLQKYMQTRQFGQDEKIYQRETPSAALYYINSGSIGLFTQVDDGHEERTQYISKGRWFGISALL
jgi:CRP-like cAMP-binding protein